MTREEAIRTLRNVAWLGTDKKVGQVEEALQMAITALQTDGDCISRRGAITIPVLPKEHRKYQTMNLDDAYELGWFDCQKCIEELPSVHPLVIHCTDCEDWHKSQNFWNVVISELPSVQAEPCEDTISRADAIRVASGYCHPANVAEELAKLPSVQPEVIRCKDCMWYLKDKNCARHMKPFKPNGFCSEAAERRTDEGD